MRLATVAIRDFKRFTDLTVAGIPATARLIMLAGPNGSGKSSFFDAIYSWHKFNSTRNSWDTDYHLKVDSRKATQWDEQQLNVKFHEPMPTAQDEKKKLIYMRSAYRNDPEYQSQRIQKLPDPLDDTRVARMIDNDAAIGRNYQRQASEVFKIFSAPPSMTNKFTEGILKPIREPLLKLFPDLCLNDLANPLEDGTFRFTKGASEGFHFKNLSGGEKAAFDLILDLAVAIRTYDNTLFCIDEPESHMNARLQSELLSVLYSLVPQNCQLMLATHSIGMMRQARDIEANRPGTVVFLDFEERDFDEQVTIEPAEPDVAFWNRVYEVALDDLASLVAPEKVIICEGEPRNSNAGQNYSHDARCYNTIFGTEFPEARFVPGGNSSEVIGDKRGIAYALGVLTEGTEVKRLVDRDSRSPEEVSELRERGILVLSRRNLESYLFDDEVLRALAVKFKMEERADSLIEQKESIRSARSQDAPDDHKPSSGEVYLACQRVLNLPASGSTTKTFMRDTLAPLVRPQMQVYADLKRDIFGQWDFG